MQISNHINNGPEQVAQDLKRLVPILGKKKAARLQTAYLLGDENYRKRVSEILDAMKASIIAEDDLKDSVLMTPPEIHVAENGEFQVGDVLYGQRAIYPLRLSRKDLLTHMGVFGSSGSGKTNIIHNLIQRLNDLEVPIIVFDFSKRNYRDLLQLPELKDRIKVYTVGRDVVPFRFNPLKPPEGVTIAQWAKEFAEVFDHAYWLLGGGRHVIMKALDNLYKHYSPEYPKLTDLKMWLDKYAGTESTSREKNWVATAKRPLDSLGMRETGEIFDCEEGILPSSFFKPGTITILEIDALSNDDKTFFIEIILQWIRDWLLAGSDREKLKGVIVLEEAHHVLSREKTKKFGTETVTDLIFREIRELGVGMVYVDQHPSLVSYPALGNTSTHLYMNLGLDTKYSSDIQDASNMLGLEKEDVDYLRRLPTGHSFILIRKSVFPNPFLISFPLVPLEKGQVTDAKVREAMGIRLIEEINRRKSNADEDEDASLIQIPKIDLSKKADPSIFAQNMVVSQQIESRMKSLSKKSWDILELLVQGDASYTSEIYKQLKMSHKTFNKEVQRLVENKFVSSRPGKVYKQTAVYFYPTHQGRLAYTMKTNRLETPAENDSSFSDKELAQMKERIKLGLTLKGLGYLKDKENDGINQMVFEEISQDKVTKNPDKRKSKKLTVTLITDERRDQIDRLIEKHALDDEMFVVAATEQAKNLALQQLAKYAHRHHKTNVLINVAVIEELKEIGFRRVEFNPM